MNHRDCVDVYWHISWGRTPLQPLFVQPPFQILAVCILPNYKGQLQLYLSNTHALFFKQRIHRETIKFTHTQTCILVCKRLLLLRTCYKIAVHLGNSQVIHELPFFPLPFSLTVSSHGELVHWLSFFKHLVLCTLTYSTENETPQKNKTFCKRGV